MDLTGIDTQLQDVVHKIAFRVTDINYRNIFTVQQQILRINARFIWPLLTGILLSFLASVFHSFFLSEKKWILAALSHIFLLILSASFVFAVVESWHTQKSVQLKSLFHYFSLNHLYRLGVLFLFAVVFGEGLSVIHVLFATPDSQIKTWTDNPHYKYPQLWVIVYATQLIFSYLISVIAIALLCISEVVSQGKVLISSGKALHTTILIFWSRPFYLAFYFWSAWLFYMINSISFTSSLNIVSLWFLTAVEKGIVSVMAFGFSVFLLWSILLFLISYMLILLKVSFITSGVVATVSSASSVNIGTGGLIK